MTFLFVLAFVRASNPETPRTHATPTCIIVGVYHCWFFSSHCDFCFWSLPPVRRFNVVRCCILPQTALSWQWISQDGAPSSLMKFLI